MNKQKSDKTARLIATNKKARYDYFIEQQFEAGLVLEGWEVKSIRAGRVQLKDSFVVFKKDEAWLIGTHISPLQNVPAHLNPDPERSRKLLLNRKELNKIRTGRERLGYTVVALDLHWHKNRVKAEIALVQGKKKYDKRETIKKRESDRELRRVLKK